MTGENVEVSDVSGCYTKGQYRAVRGRNEYRIDIVISSYGPRDSVPKAERVALPIPRLTKGQSTPLSVLFEVLCFLSVVSHVPARLGHSL